MFYYDVLATSFQNILFCRKQIIIIESLVNMGWVGF